MIINTFSRKLGLLGSASFIALLSPSAAFAQTAQVPEPPVNSMIDARGVDLMSGQLMVDFTPLTIGDSDHGLKQSLYYPGLYGFRHDQMITALVDDYDSYGVAYGYHVTVATGKVANGFTWNGSIYISDKGDGATLTFTLAKWTYTDHNGVVVELDRTQGPGYTSGYDSTSYYGGVDGIATMITRPDGFKTRLIYKTGSYYYSGYGTVYTTRLQSSTTSSGYQLKFKYKSDTLAQASANDWVGIAQEQMINNAVDYCDPAADSCAGLTQSWPTMTVGSSVSGTNGILSFIDPVGRSSSFTFDSSGRIIGYRRPNASADTVTYGYVTGTTGISSVTLAGVGTWNYAFSYNSGNGVLSATVTTPTVATPLSVTANYSIRQPLTVTDENGHQTTMVYDAKGRITQRTPDGAGSNYTTYAYDTRGNLTSMVLTPKGGSGLATLSTSATYAANPCVNIATCNKPTSTTNSENQVTNTYYNSNGTLDYVQSPAPVPGGVRPESHNSYTTAQARVKNASGSIVPQGDVVTLPTGSITCVSGSYASCTGANQIVSQVAYDTGVGGTNLAAKVTTVKSGSGSPSSTTAYTYGIFGDVASVIDPVGNVSTTNYALDRQPTLTVGPSVDGSPSSNRRGVQYHYNADGLPDIVTSGSYNPSSQALTAMVVGATTYDTQGRKTKDSVSDGSTTYALSQYSYNGAGQLDCTATRMNPATFTALPASACTPGTQGSAGPDRITHYVYDNVGQVLKTQSAYGVSGQQRDDVTYTYTSHNQRQTMTDPAGNLTSFVYDGHDRLLRTCYQGSLVICQGGTASDYVQLGYNSAGRPVSRSLRGTPGSVLGYTYDYLGRVTNISYPGGDTFDQPVALAYDNIGRTLSATDASGHSVGYGYDAVGNVLTQGDAISSRAMLYDAAGRRTRLTWSDGRFVTYEYNGTSALTAIRESGSAALATFAYDAIGRRTSLSRGNGVGTAYNGYSPLGVSTIGIDLAGTANDLTLGFTYTPAGQIGSRTSTSANNAWSYGENYTVNRSYAVNTLNQYTASGSIVPTYDARGNLTSAGTPAYGYSTKNELVRRTDAGTSFYHDPLGQLDTITSASATTRFQYDGPNISTELDGATNGILKRYVYGPGTDEPLVQYEGADFSIKRYLVADERGSVIAVTDTSGNPVTINAYDDYGIPASTNQGRFQYTGQAWIPELGMYSYKARIYSPTLGRFLQTDPAGYPDGPNWYAYAMNDPVNRRDPLGWCSGPPYYEDCEIVVTAGGGGGGGGGGFGGGLDWAIAAQMQAMRNAAVYANNFSAAQSNGGRQQSNQGCVHKNSTAATVAKWADSISTGAGVVAGVSAGLGLATAPTGAGFIGFEAVAAGAATVSTVAAGVGAVANAIDGNWQGAGWDVAGLLGGSLVGRVAKNAYQSTRAFGDLSASQARGVNFLGYGAGNAIGSAQALVGCQ